MGKRPWGAALLLLGGTAMGIAVAGVPSRHQDPPLRGDAVRTTLSTTTTTVAPPTPAPPAPGAPTTTTGG